MNRSVSAFAFLHFSSRVEKVCRMAGVRRGGGVRVGEGEDVRAPAKHAGAQPLEGSEKWRARKRLRELG